jgi:hypothetical protein
MPDEARQGLVDQAPQDGGGDVAMLVTGTRDQILSRLHPHRRGRADEPMALVQPGWSSSPSAFCSPVRLRTLHTREAASCHPAFRWI